MITNIDIDESLVADAMQVTGARTKREVVDRALREMVARARRTRVRDMWGIAIEDGFWPDYDPKGSPGEPAGTHRVEQGVAAYKVPPARSFESAESAESAKSAKSTRSAKPAKTNKN
jgi:hypothetical protein